MNQLSTIASLAPSVSLTSMTSTEISTLLEARHDNVKRTVERLSSRGVIQLPPLVEVINHQGRTVSEYVIGKRDTYIVVAQLSPEFTGRLVDRWQELESAMRHPPLNVSDLSISETSDLMSALLEHESGQLERFIEDKVRLIINQSPPLEGVNQVVENPNEILTASQLGFHVRLSAHRINRILVDLGLQVRNGPECIPTRAAAGHYEVVKSFRNREGRQVSRIKWKRSVLQLIPERYLS